MTGWAAKVEDDAQRQRVRRRFIGLLTAAVVVPCLLVGSLLLAAEKRDSERLRLHGVALTGRTWYLTSVSRLGRTWVPQAVSTLRFASDHSAVTFDGANDTNWAVHFGGGALRASVHGERGTVGGTLVSYEVGQAVETVFKGHTTLSLVGDSLSVASSRGTLRYATVAPTLAPTGTVTIGAQETMAGTTRAVPATLSAHDADGLQLWQWAAPAAGATLSGLATGTYAVTATTNGATCSPTTVSVISGQTVNAAVLCHP